MLAHVLTAITSGWIEVCGLYNTLSIYLYSMKKEPFFLGTNNMKDQIHHRGLKYPITLMS